MKKLLTTTFALAVACATAPALAQKVTGNAEAGSGKAQMCMGCHGIVGYQASFPEVYKVPKIAGQSATYIVSALDAYRDGDRRHPTMHGVAVSLTDQDIADLAAFYSQLGMKEGDAVPATAAAPSEQVQALITRDKDSNCTKCHGANFNTPNDGTVPKLAGQNPDYLVVALKAYQSPHPLIGRPNPIMGKEAKQFSNAELKQLADYIGSLPGDVKTVPESRFHHDPAATASAK